MMKLLIVAAATFLFFFVDFPDRLAAEKEKPLKATVTGYHYEKYKKSPYYVEAKGEDGKVYRNSDSWSVRWLNVGSSTEIKQGKRVYIGNFLLRMSLYTILFPLLLISMLWTRKDRAERHD